MSKLSSRFYARTTGLLGGLFLSVALHNQPPAEAENIPDSPRALLNQAASENSSDIQRTHRTIRLGNGLEVLLTHDPQADQSAASLSVGAGSLYDPENKQGLAHYLEHMILQGNRENPDPESYRRFLDIHSGSINATTSDSVTNYFFDVGPDAFDEALRRFSSIFKSPLLAKDRSEKEIHAINSEFDKNLHDDEWRMNHLINQLARPGHPVRKFSLGSKASLAGDNQKALQEFFQTYYAARNMKLALISRDTLDRQEALVRQYFSDIPDFDVAHPVIKPDFRPAAQDSYHLVGMETIGDQPMMVLEFPTVRLPDYKESNPLGIIGSVISYEGKGSLLSQLKKEGLATALSVSGGAYEHPDINTARININLTNQGLEQHELVMQRFFAYVNMLKSEGIKRYSFDENQKMAAVNYQWKAPEQGSTYVAAQTQLMQRYPLDKILTQPYLLEKHDPDAYRRVLDTIHPANMLAVVRTNSVEAEKTEPIFGIRYFDVKVSGPSYENLLSPPLVEGMHYPEPNPFIPDKPTLVPQAQTESAANGQPHLVVNNALGRVWSLYDTQFLQPRGYITLHMGTPHVSDNVENFVKTFMLQSCVTEYMNDQTYPLRAAGLEYGLNFDTKGILLSFGGYTDRLPDLVDLVARNITDCKLDETRFNILKEQHLHEWDLEPTDQTQVAFDALSRMISHKDFPPQEKQKALQPLTLTDIQNFGRHIFDNIRMTGMAHGNWNDRDVRQIVDIVLRETKSQPLTWPPDSPPETPPIRTREKAVLSLTSSSNNNAIVYALYGGYLDPKRWVAMTMMENITKADFFDQIRTRQQSGYIANTFSQYTDDHMYTGYVVQSADYGPSELQKRIEKWMERIPSLIQALTDDEFATLKKNAAASHRASLASLADAQDALFVLAHEKKEDFDFFKKSASLFENLTRDDVMAMARELSSNGNAGRIIVQTKSPSFREQMPPNAYRSVEEFRSRAFPPVKTPPANRLSPSPGN